MRRVLSLTCLAILLCGASLSAVSRTAPQDDNKKTESDPFGYSLKYLKWDPISNHAIDYSEVYKPAGNKPRRAPLPGTNNLSYTSKKADRTESDVTLQSTLVTFDVVVTDKTGRYINGLTKNDFNIIEDNTAQQVGTVSIGAGVPRSIVLIVDYSSSGFTFFDASIEAAKTLVSQLSPQDQMAIVTDDVELLCNYTSDKQKLASTLDVLKTRAKRGMRGRSLQFTALMATMRELIREDDDRSIIVFQTDGDESFRLRDQGSAREKFYPEMRLPASGEFGLVDVMNKARRIPATIYSVVPGEQLINVDEKVNKERGLKMYQQAVDAYNKNGDLRVIPEETPEKFIGLRTLGQLAAAFVANATGGWTGFLQSPDKASEIYGKILADINHGYVIAYYPANEARDGKRRNVKIEVRGHPEYVIQGRNTYYAPSK